MTGTLSAESSFSDYVKEEDPEFLEALQRTALEFPEEVQVTCDDVQLPRKRLKTDQLLSTPQLPVNTTTTTTSTNTEAPDVKEYVYSPFVSNEHAQRLMNNPHFRAGHTSAAGGDFIDGFYKNSRLHYLSTWKAELKLLVAEAQEKAEKAFGSGDDSDKKADSFESGMVGKVDGASSTGVRGNALALLGSAHTNSKGKNKQDEIDLDTVIMHCDFDCFFASVGLLTRSYLKDKPVVVCHSQGTQGGDKSTSEVSSANYKAREFGIRNGISLQSARKLCPSLVTIPYEFERYKKVSLQLYTILMSHADDLQAVSVDEALIDVTTAVKQLPTTSEKQDPAKTFALMLRSEIKAATGCDVSIGISHNITLARLATRKAKPAGVFHLRLADLQKHIEHMCIDELHGFGPAARSRALERLGAATLGELAKKPRGVLCDALGRQAGSDLYDIMRGVDKKKLESDKPRRSVSAEINYGIRFENSEQAQAFMFQLGEEVSRRLDTVEMRGRSLTLKIMKRDPDSPVEPPKFLGHGCCQVFSKQAVLIDSRGHATSDALLIGQLAWKLLKSFAFDPKELRGIGIQIQKLEKAISSAQDSGGRELAQSKLVFKSKKEPSSSQELEGTKEKEVSGAKVNMSILPPSSSPKPHHDEEENEDEIVEITPPTITQPPLAGQASTLALPSFSQVDNTVFGALPTQMREEIKGEYSRRSASPARSALGERYEAFSLSPPSSRKRGSGSGSGKGVRTNKGTPLSRITQALAPRTRTGDARSGASAAVSRLVQNGVGAEAGSGPGVEGGTETGTAKTGGGGGGNIFEKCERQKERRGTRVEVTRVELARLGMDVGVFVELPLEVQLEQLASARFGRVFGGGGGGGGGKGGEGGKRKR